LVIVGSRKTGRVFALLSGPDGVARKQVPKDHTTGPLTVPANDQISPGSAEEEHLSHRLDVGRFERSDEGVCRGRPEGEKRPLSEYDEGTIWRERGRSDGLGTVGEGRPESPEGF